MKNITVSVDEDTYRRARIAAAENDTSVSALVRAFLAGLADRDHGRNAAFNAVVADRLRRQATASSAESDAQRFNRLRREEIDLRKSFVGFSGSDRLAREDLYDRSRR